MPTYTATAFNWSATGYNSVYTQSHSVTFTDNDGQYQGGADGDERVSIDGGPEQATTLEPYSIDVSFTDTDGNPHVETFQFFDAGGEWYFVPGPGSAFSEGATLGNYQSHTVGWDYDSIACFAAGTAILTLGGNRRADAIAADDLLPTWGGGLVRVQMVLHSPVSRFEMTHCARLRPVRIRAGALGAGLPRADLMVSRQHRMLIRSRIADRMFGRPEVLVAAAQLLGLEGVDTVLPRRDMTYCHILCDRHAVLLAEGAPSESLMIGDRAADILKPEDLRKIDAMKPSPAGPCPARMIPDRRRQKQLIARHLANGRPVLSLSRSGLQPVKTQKVAGSG